MDRLHKYPRTHHIEGSRLQPGDQDLDAVPFRELASRPLVVEEKIDGANVGLSFDASGALLLQSRGHFLRGGANELQFSILKAWAHARSRAFFEVLADRYVLYGEWLYAQHTVHYDLLPHFFLEFDVLDKETGAFLSTPRRRALLGGLPICSVPVLREGSFARLDDLTALVGPSRYKSDRTSLMEGLYVKLEDGERVVERFKFIRASFLQTIVDSGTHWMDRPFVPNCLAPGVDIFR